MPQLVDHVAYLAQEIGPRPAGTEEEQQAALYIADQMQKEAGLPAVVEDFNGFPNADIPRTIISVLSILSAVVAVLISAAGIVSIIVSLIAVILFIVESFGYPYLSKALARGVSQNVVAKYDPGYSPESGGSRRRKIIVVAHYDSGKVRPELSGLLLRIFPYYHWVLLGALVVMPILLIFHNILFYNSHGIAALIIKIFIVLTVIIEVIPLVLTLVYKFASYNEGANCNASATAVLLEAARRVSQGREGNLDDESLGVSIHGQEAARAAGLIPDGVEVVYEGKDSSPTDNAESQSPEVRLASAKAAVAALSGEAIAGVEAMDIAHKLVQVKEPPLPQPSEERYHEIREETRAAFASIPTETVATALEHAGISTDSSAEQGLLNSEEAAKGVPAITEESSSLNPDVSPHDIPSENPFPTPSDGVPQWFKNAQEKAKKPRSSSKPVQRSRYASALDEAMNESAGHFAEANSIVEKRLEKTLSAGREEIHEIKAPQWGLPSEQQDVSRKGAQETPQKITNSPKMESFEGDISPRITASPAQTQDRSFLAEEETAQEAPYYSEKRVKPLPGHKVDTSLGEKGVSSDKNEVEHVLSAGVSSKQESSAHQDIFATTALAPIDVSDLSVPHPVTEPDLPAFLDPQKAQERKKSLYQTDERTRNRLNVTTGEAGVTELPLSSQGQVATRRPIVLPTITPASQPLSVTEMQKQRAPLSDVENAGKVAAKSLLTMLPAIDVDAQKSSDEDPSCASAEVSSRKKAALRTEIPSLSGEISSSTQGAGVTSKIASVSSTGSFVPAGATGTFAPVGDELLENVDPEDIYIDDADDSAFEEGYTETGAFAGPGYVDMPKSRGKRLFDRFRRKGKHDEQSAQEWLDVDESFDARSVGAKRGGWESFREDSEENESHDGESYSAHPPTGPSTHASPSSRPWNGGGFSTHRLGEDGAVLEEDPLYKEAKERDSENYHSEELQQIYQFKNPDITTEVWFVALGSELAQNSGMRAFLAEHQQDLHGAIIVNLEALGSGNLCMVEKEGLFHSAKTSSRMKRYIKKASQASGVNVGGVHLLWEESPSSFAIKKGYQAMSLSGILQGKPAYYAQNNDVLDAIEEDTLEANTRFLMELLKNI